MADSPVLYVYYRPDNDDSYPGVPNRHITEADWARFSLSQRRTVEQATTQDGYTRRKVWVHIDLVDETEQERAEREAREQAAREAYERGNSLVRYRELEPLLPGTALDIWDAFDATGERPSIGWDASTYPKWMDGIDRLLAKELADGTVVKADLGPSANPDHHVYSYAAGNPNGGTALIVAGQHPEWIGIHAAMRFFEQFAKGTHPAMRALRERMRVVWVPTADPHREYNNANGIQTNRNFDFWWDRYVEVGGSPKGAAPFDQPESRILRDLVINEKPSIVIDCHNKGGATGNTVEWGMPSRFTLSPRPFVLDAMAAWNASYNATGEMALSEFDPVNPPHYSPYFHNWAMYHMRAVQGNRRAVSLTLETGVDLFGSTPTLTTRRAIQAYAGILHTVLTRWLYAGGSAVAVPYTYAFTAYRHSEQPTVSIQSGGSLIDTADPVYVPWLNTVPNQFGSRTTIHAPAPYAPALITVRASGTIQTSRVTAGQGAGRLLVAIERDGGDEAQSVVWLDFPASTGTSESPSVTFYTEVSRPVTTASKTLENAFRLKLDVNYGGGRELVLAKARMSVTVTPHTHDFPAVQWEP